MSAKFKPRKKEIEAVVDDWDASGSENEESSSRGIAAQQKTISEGTAAALKHTSVASSDVWEDASTSAQQRQESGPSSQSRPSGRALWEDANKTAPPAQPLLANGRSLPSSILAPRISSHSPGSSSPSAPGNSDEYNSRPPPQILRREQRKDGGAGTNSAAHQMQKKTLAEREDEYRKARERIFGTSDAKARSPSSQNGSAGKASPGTGSRQRSGHTTPTSEGEKASTRQP